MTIDEITSEVRKHTYGLLNDGEVVASVELILASHNGIDPDDIEDVTVSFKDSGIDISVHLRESNQLTLF
jgi:hypothetical protein